MLGDEVHYLVGNVVSRVLVRIKSDILIQGSTGSSSKCGKTYPLQT